MASLEGDDDNNFDDEVVPLVLTSDTITNNGIRSTGTSSSQMEGTEDEYESTNGTKHNTIKNKVMSKQHQSRLRCILICVILSMTLVLYAKRRNSSSNLDESQPTGTSSKPKPPHHNKSTGIQKPKMTLKSLLVLKQKVTQAHEKFNQQLQTQYGEYYEDIFYTKNKTQSRISRGSILFESGNPKSNLSKLRFRRKLMMKLLEASAYTYHDDDSATSTTIDTTTFFRDTKFVWATGGHSATAGHGNFYNESYTAYVQYALEGIFRSVDVELITRKYAMGGTAAGSELALCSKEIYGTDFDVLVWDFGMTDGNNYWKQGWYNYRANLLPKQNPIHLAYHAGKRNSPRFTHADKLEKMGMAAIISDDDVISKAEEAMPDTLGMSDEKINALPEYVRNYKCGNEFEAGEPYCKSDKFRHVECADRKFQTSWHPGWKWHALMGYLASYYVIDVLYSAMDELATQLITNDAVKLYNILQDANNQDYDLFRSAAIPEHANILADIDDADFNGTHIISGPNYCHTTRLPAEIRFLGILTETTTQIGPSGYDKGIGVHKLLETVYTYDVNVDANSSGGVQPMILSYDENDRQSCPISTNEDYKDFFYVGANTGWRQLILPNQFERNAYNSNVDGSSVSSPLLHGYVAMCLTLCNWDVCPGNAWGRTIVTQNSSLLDIRVNQVMVTNYTNMGNSECDLLRHHDGYRFPVNEKENTITIEVRLNIPDKSYLRISSWIVW